MRAAGWMWWRRRGVGSSWGKQLGGPSGRRRDVAGWEGTSRRCSEARSHAAVRLRSGVSVVAPSPPACRLPLWGGRGAALLLPRRPGIRTPEELSERQTSDAGTTQLPSRIWQEGLNQAAPPPPPSQAMGTLCHAESRQHGSDNPSQAPIQAAHASCT